MLKPFDSKKEYEKIDEILIELFIKKFDNKLLSLIGIVSYVFLQILLNKITYSYIYIGILSFLYALYRRGYWIARRFYNLKSGKYIFVVYTNRR